MIKLNYQRWWNKMEYNIQDKTITDLRKDLDNGVVTSEELFNESVDLANKFQADYNAFVTILSKYKMKKKKEIGRAHV